MKKTLPRLGAPLLTILFSILLMTYVSSLADPDLGASAFRLYRTAMLLTSFMALSAFLMDMGKGIRLQSMILSLSILSSCGCTIQFLLGNIKAHLVYQILFMAAAAAVFLFLAGRCAVSDLLFYLAAGGVVILLALNYFFGSAPPGGFTTARLWLFIGGVSVQPGEMVKILLIFLGAASYRKWQRCAVSFALCLSSCLILLKLSDMGNAAVIFLILVVQVFYLLDSWKLALLLVTGAFTAFAWLIRHSAYASARLSNWGHAMERPGGVHQQADLLEAILFGGLINGVGADHAGSLKSIYAIDSDMALGALLAVFGAGILFIVLGAYVILIWQAAGNHSVYPFSHLVLVQASMLIFAQVFLNFGGSIDLIPFTGITAPLLSLGGSSMVCFGALTGMCLAAECPILKSTDSTARETENVDILSNLLKLGRDNLKAAALRLKEVICTVLKKDTEN